MNNEKTDFFEYERVRASGLYNMITESAEAMTAMGLDPSSTADSERYLSIISRYGKLRAKYCKRAKSF